MKKIIKGANLFFIVVLLSIFSYPTITYGLEKQPYYINKNYIVSNAKYTANEEKTTGSHHNFLVVEGTLAARHKFFKEYFIGTRFTSDFMYYIMFIVPILLLAVSTFLWYKSGKDDPVEEIVQFYPPAGLNSLEAGFLYKGKADSKDVISLLIYLANKGYIKISATEKESLFSASKGFKITKLREYAGSNINEQLFLDGLFSKKSLFRKTCEDNSNEVTSKDLYNSFYIIVRKVLCNINNKENRNKIFERDLLYKRVSIILMIVLTYYLITLPPVFTYGTNNLIFALLLPVIAIIFVPKMLFDKTRDFYINGKVIYSPIGKNLFTIAWGSLLGGVPWTIAVLPALLKNITYLMGYITGLVCIFGMIICLGHLEERTVYGNETSRKLRGLKNFIVTAEKNRLETIAMQDPNYFYNILPYAYILDVSDKWIEKFRSISLQSPPWYDSVIPFNVVTFGSFINKVMKSVQSTSSGRGAPPTIIVSGRNGSW